MRTAISTLFLCLVFSLAQAADKRKYAALSLIGDQILVVQQAPTLGGRLDRNTRDYLQMSDGLLDKVVLRTIDEALRKLDASNPPVLLFARERELYTAQAKLLDTGQSSSGLLGLLQKLLQGTEATHLILVTKLRHEAEIKLKDTLAGTGTLEGAGFYVDADARTQNSATGEFGTGILGPFAYFRVELIDVARGEILKEQKIVASTSFTSASSTSGDAWTALSSRDKVRVLRDLVARETARVIPALIGTSQTP